MGLSIHYSGRMDDAAQLGGMCDELQDIAQTMNWVWSRMDEDWDKPNSARLASGPHGAEVRGHLPLKGISISPGDNCESLRFFCDREGNLRDAMSMIMLHDGTVNPEDVRISVKTQFSSPELHMIIIKLLKYLKKRYVSSLTVEDEGEYWQTGDRETLASKMTFLGSKIEEVGRVLSEAKEPATARTPQELLVTIERILREKLQLVEQGGRWPQPKKTGRQCR